MAVIKKTLLRTGIHESPQGRLVATPKRLQHWANQFKKMQSAGIRVPVAWGHQPKAEPGAEKDRATSEYWKSKFNAGYLKSLAVGADGNVLDMKLDVPGAEIVDGKLVTETTLTDGRKVKAAIAEVSAAIKKSWTDGTGKTWNDCVLHVAMVPLPVVTGQDGFKNLGTAEPDGDTVYLGTSTRTRNLAAGEEEEADKEKDDEPDVEVVEDEEEGGEGEKPGDGLGDTGSDEQFKQCLEYLKGRGIHLPEDTTPDSLIERLCIACHAIEGNEAEDDDAAPADAGGGVVNEEQQPTMMMSLSTCETGREKKLLEREQRRHRGDLNKRIDRLLKRGMPPAKATKLRDKIGSYELGLDDEGAVVPRNVDLEIAIWEEALPPKKFKDEYLLGNSVEQQRPAGEDGDEDEIKKVAAERAKRISVSH